MRTDLLIDDGRQQTLTMLSSKLLQCSIDLVDQKKGLEFGYLLHSFFQDTASTLRLDQVDQRLIAVQEDDERASQEFDELISRRCVDEE
jgi:hypothetical protein